MPAKISTCLLIALALLAVAGPVPATDDASPETAVCHVCRVHEGETEAEKVAATAEHDGTTYGFCSEACRDKFVEAPAGYLPPTFPRPAPAFEVLTLDGETVSSEVLDGQWTLLDFWATWCQPCVTDLPELTALHERYGDRGFAVVGVSIDEGRGAAEKVERMAERREARHPIYLDSESSPAWAAYDVRVVPAQFLIDPEGQIVAQWSGKIDLEVVEAEIVRRLDGADADEPEESDIGALDTAVRDGLRAARLLRDREAKRAAFGELVPLARRLADTRPDADSWYALVAAHLGARDYERGRAVAERWAAEEPDHWMPHLFTGQAMTWQESYEPAIGALERALEMAPSARERRTAAMSLGFALENARRFDEAMAVYREVADEHGVERVRGSLESLAMANDTSAIDDGCVLRADMLADAEPLEALDDPDGR